LSLRQIGGQFPTKPTEDGKKIYKLDQTEQNTFKSEYYYNTQKSLISSINTLLQCHCQFKASQRKEKGNKNSIK